MKKFDDVEDDDNKEILLQDIIIRGYAQENGRLIDENKILKMNLNRTNERNEEEKKAMATKGRQTQGSWMGGDETQQFKETIHRLQDELERKDKWYKERETDLLKEVEEVNAKEVKAQSYQTDYFYIKSELDKRISQEEEFKNSQVIYNRKCDELDEIKNGYERRYKELERDKDRLEDECYEINRKLKRQQEEMLNDKFKDDEDKKLVAGLKKKVQELEKVLGEKDKQLKLKQLNENRHPNTTLNVKFDEKSRPSTGSKKTALGANRFGKKAVETAKGRTAATTGKRNPRIEEVSLEDGEDFRVNEHGAKNLVDMMSNNESYVDGMFGEF